MGKFFKPEHVYGQVLEFLYDHPDKRFDLKHLQQQLKCDPTYLKTQLESLAEDKLIFVSADLVNTKTGGNHPTYGLAYQGFRFVSELENIHSAKSHSITANRISVLALLVALVGLFIQPYINKPATQVNDYIKSDSAVIDKSTENSQPAVSDSVKVK